jgi:hypothetical protein
LKSDSIARATVRLRHAGRWIVSQHGEGNLPCPVN